MLKNLQKSIVQKVLILFLGTFFTLFIVSYALFKNFLMENMQSTKLESVMYEVNMIWFGMFILFLLLTFGVYLLVNSMATKIEDDVTHINTYLTEVNNKNYDAIIIIENYMEFLQASLLLKNIVKRLKSRSKNK